MISRRSLLATASASFAALATGATARPFFDRNRHPIGINLYVVAGLVASDPVGAIRSVAEIGYREVETGLEGGHSAATIGRAIADAGLRCASLNLLPRAMRGGRSLADPPGEVAHDAHLLKAAYVTCTLFPLPGVVDMHPMPGEATKALLERVSHEASRDEWKRAADYLNTKGRELAREGVALAYHNHNPELAHRCANGSKQQAGPCASSRPTAPTSIRSKRPFPSSRPCSGRSASGP